MTNDKDKYREMLLTSIEIQNRVVKNSQYFDKATKDAIIDYSKKLKELLDSKLTLAQLRSLTSDLLTFWKESIGLDIETFWTELKDHDIEFERKDELKFALSKGRFRRVDQGMAAREHWENLKNLETITTRFTQGEIQKIGEIISEDEKNRLEILKKCLRKKSIPQTQYLKFGECMAYFRNCELFGKYFTNAEESELYEIWRDFKSK
ncbi:hypothetical protein [Xanthovirga aplysinae]|uniref:hypothetical protein n=1 Tax=Xanthovirga aplysinae TaxID=2529853 RepID=UPI0012BBD5A4|nr:hypothetical protein [Xanthovirga aplysinae]MTI29283.1 hypothetical protein [Xanthovirga aplysinae]